MLGHHMQKIEIYYIIFFYFIKNVVYSFLEQGVWKFDIDKNESYIAVSKLLFSGSNIIVKINCDNDLFMMNVKWLLRRSPCADEYSFLNYKNDLVPTYFNNLNAKPLQFIYDTIEYQLSKSYDNPDFKNCINRNFFLENEFMEKHYSIPTLQMNNSNIFSYIPSLHNNYSKDSQNSNTFDVENNNEENKEIQKMKSRNRKKSNSSNVLNKRLKRIATKDNELNYNNIIAKTWNDGNYMLILKFEIKSDDESLNIKRFGQVLIEMKRNKNSHLSVHDWPLLPFFACMCVLYIMYLLLWSFWCIKYRNELLRIQYCIAGVIFLGFLEKSIFLGEYHNVDQTGISIYGALVFAEIVSALKRSLSRILIIVASIGYGIVKPRLGEAMKRVIVVGVLYFVFALTESLIRISKNHATPNGWAIIATISVSILEAVICWWIFSGLVYTLRILKVRQNLVKLTMYRQFTNILVACVIASTCFMMWSLKEHKFITCVKNYKQLWLDEAFWHLLFSIILLAIIILWRPSANNQRYAFTPLLDDSKYADDELYGDGTVVSESSDDEGPEDTLYNAKGILKMRSFSKNDKQPLVSSHTNHQQNIKTNTEADLKWIEDNIPPSIADTALPNLIDSDEEENIRRFEMGKMQ